MAPHADSSLKKTPGVYHRRHETPALATQLPARVFSSSQLRVVKAQVEVEVEIPRETPIGQPLSRGGAGRKYDESGSAGLSDLEKQTRLTNAELTQCSCLVSPDISEVIV